MVRKTKNSKADGTDRDQLDDDIDALFKLPLAEFTAARNSLMSQLKKSGRGDEAEYLKTLAKPPISAWAVNQLYWRHRKLFDRLIESGERFRQAQSSTGARKVADMRAALDARRESLSELSDLASDLLREAGHNPTQEFTRRIATTLEAMSAYATEVDGPRSGRLTQDVDPPGFESLASFVPSTGAHKSAKEPVRSGNAKKVSSKTGTLDKDVLRKSEAANEAREREKDRQLAVAAAKAAAQEAKRHLAAVRLEAQTLESAHKKAHAEARDAEKQRREAESLFVRAKAVAEDATEKARRLADQANQASQDLEEAKRAVAKTSKELEKIFRSPNK